MSSVIDIPYRFIGKLIAKMLAKAKVTPNQVTYFRFLLGIIATYYFYLGNRFLKIGVIILQVSFLLDYVDGELARLRSMSSNFGILLEGFFDRAQTAILIFGITWGVYNNTNNYFVWILGFASVYSILSMFILSTSDAWVRKCSQTSPISPEHNNSSKSNSAIRGKRITKVIKGIFMTYYLGWVLNITIISILGILNQMYLYLIFASTYGVLYLFAYFFVVILPKKKYLG